VVRFRRCVNGDWAEIGEQTSRYKDAVDPSAGMRAVTCILTRRCPDRLVHRVVRVDPIPATTPGLFDAARILKLRIEEDGGGRYVVPYEE
jgi:hypothetical protein